MADKSKSHRNNIGVLRILFASAVIVGHSPEIIDGDRSREPLWSLFGTTTLGHTAVIAFFAISGYLITQSFMRLDSIKVFIAHRVGRIYPGYFVAYLACVLVLAPLAGANIAEHSLPAVFRMFALQSPYGYEGLFPGLTHYQVLNGAMWTISYEFRCYLFTILAGLAAKRFGPRVFIALWLFFQAATVLISFEFSQPIVKLIESIPFFKSGIGQINDLMPLMSAYCAGSVCYGYWDKIAEHLSLAVRIALGVVGLAALFNPHLSEIGMHDCLVPLMFWLAFRTNLGWFGGVNSRNDISYGVYLYGWPVQITLIWLYPSLGPIPIAVLGVMVACIFGKLSWHFVERPGRRWVQRWAEGRWLTTKAA